MKVNPPKQFFNKFSIDKGRYIVSLSCLLALFTPDNDALDKQKQCQKEEEIGKGQKCKQTKEKLKSNLLRWLLDELKGLLSENLYLSVNPNNGASIVKISQTEIKV